MTDKHDSVFCYASIPYINRLERMILVHSYIYYELGENIISDDFFDCISNDLLKCMSENRENFMNSDYFKCFADFDGNSGYYLDYKRPEIISVSNRIMKKYGYN